jgi:uncharacterized protein YndB with AHSA1/START domain
MTITPVHRLERSVLVRARPGVVFAFLTEPAKWAAWWGDGSTIDARPGGRMLIRHPNGVLVSGIVEEVLPPQRIVFTYGYASGTPFPPGGSRVTIRLHPDEEGTRLHLVHDFADAVPRDEHLQGWRYQLSLFANLVADTTHADAADVVDRWFAAWSDAGSGNRNAVLAQILSPRIQVSDRFSCLAGPDDVSAHLAAVHRFMPGMRMTRVGDVRQCQGLVLADWVARGSDGAERGRGTNVFRVDIDGRIDAVTGFWGQP